MSIKRGFKAEAERISQELRNELKLAPTDPLDVFDLAQHLCIPVVGIGELAVRVGEPTFGWYFRVEDTESFSAATLFHGRKRVVIHNDSHAPTRQRSNVAHELSHCILEHEPGPILGQNGFRSWNEGVEMEATWLAGALLVPRPGALILARSGTPDFLIARHFGVSESLCRWRISETGIEYQMQRLGQLRRRIERTAC